MNDYITAHDRLKELYRHTFSLEEKICLTVALAIVILLSCSMEVHASELVCKRSGVVCNVSLVPMSLSACDGVLRLKRLKGRSYAIMSQELPSGGKWAWSNICLWRNQ